MSSKQFEQGFSEYLDGAVHDNIAEVIFYVIREAYTAGHRAARRELGLDDDPDCEFEPENDDKTGGASN